MTNVGKGKAIPPPGSVHDRGLYLGCMILIAPSGGWGCVWGVGVWGVCGILLQVLTVI